jgi:FkbM family methyltransferase
MNKILDYVNSIGGCDGLVYAGVNTGRELPFCKTFAKNIYAFEPIREQTIWEELSKHRDSNTFLYNLALGDFTGISLIYPASNNYESSSMLEPTEHVKNEFNLQFENPIEILVEQLKNFDFFNSCNILILDVQGAEIKVLNGIDNFDNIKLVVTEYTSSGNLYSGGCTFDDIYRKLIDIGFHFCETFDTYNNPIMKTVHGNAIFRKL